MPVIAHAAHTFQRFTAENYYSKSVVEVEE